ncbi:MAG: WYL domain-containing protein [Victivallaceae bacterium]|nr:WYL domain-containing protein [Victivallaceae bacterium]
MQMYGNIGIQRWTKIIGMLKRHVGATREDILNELNRTEFSLKAADLSCNRRTLEREFKKLKDQYGAPIKFDRIRGVYYLTDKSWTLPLPPELEAQKILALTLGQKIASDIFPSDLSSQIDAAVNEIIKGSDASSCLSLETLDSLKILSDAVVSVKNEIFMAIYEAWKDRKLLEITYADRTGNTDRIIEPHTLVFYATQWSIKGFCRLRNATRTFHLSRILDAKVLDETFSPNEDIIKSVTTDKFLDYEKIPDVVIRVNNDGLRFAKIHTLHSRQTFEPADDCGWSVMRVPAASLEQTVPWILQQQGNAVPVEPPELVQSVKEAIEKLRETCR